MIGLQSKTLIVEIIYKVSLTGGYENTDAHTVDFRNLSQHLYKVLKTLDVDELWTVLY